MLGSIIGAGISAAGSIFGGISASKAMRKMRKSIIDQQRKNRDWYNRRYNEDATKRADAQAMLTRVEDSIRKRNRQAAGAKAVMGGTEESVAAAKEMNNEALSNAAAQVVANGERRKDAIDAQFRQTDANLQSQLEAVEAGKAQAISSAIQGVTGAAGNIASALDGDDADDGASIESAAPSGSYSSGGASRGSVTPSGVSKPTHVPAPQVPDKPDPSKIKLPPSFR